MNKKGGIKDRHQPWAALSWPETFRAGNFWCQPWANMGSGGDNKFKRAKQPLTLGGANYL